MVGGCPRGAEDRSSGRDRVSRAAGASVTSCPREGDTCMVIDLQQHDELVRDIDRALRRFEKGAPPPLVARDLLSELAAALAESNPAEAGLSASHLRAAREAAARGVEGLGHVDPVVQARGAERALGALSRIFRDQARRVPRRGGLERPPATGEKTRDRVPRWLLITLSLVVAGGVAAGVVARSTHVNPRWGTDSGYASGAGDRFKISFVVSPPMVVEGVHHIEITDVAHWHASCRSGRTWVDQSQAFWTSFSAWSERDFNYVTGNAYGNYADGSGATVSTEDIHIVGDMGHFITPTRAAGLFSLSLALYQDGRQIDACRTGTVRWSADWVAD
jgi:hypothetical protein